MKRMNRTVGRGIRFRSAVLNTAIGAALTAAACSYAYLTDGTDVATSGFLTNHCYQAVITVDPDPSAAGLVERRDSAFLNAKQADLAAIALENLAAYCLAEREKAGTLRGNPHEDKSEILRLLNGITRGGRIAFVYYNEQGAAVVGYRIFRIGFKKKIDAVIRPPEPNTQKAPSQ